MNRARTATDWPAADLVGGAIGAIHRNWGWFLALGIAMVLLGVFALVASVAATIASVLFIGSLLIIDGTLQVILAFRTHAWNERLLYLLAGVLGLGLGILLVVDPVAGALSLTLVLSAYFLAAGVFQIVGSSMIRFPGWGWTLAGGVIDVVLGLLIFAEWPSSALWVLGAFLGIYLIFRGWAYIMLALAVRNTFTRPA